MFAGPRQVGVPEGSSRRADNPILQFVGFRLIEGLINLRGSVIPIINLRERFGLPRRDLDDETRTIVVNIQDKTVGCIVDAVTQVMRINRDAIQPPPLTMLSVSQQYISGLARLDDRLLIILDIDALFDVDQLVPPSSPVKS